VKFPSNNERFRLLCWWSARRAYAIYTPLMRRFCVAYPLLLDGLPYALLGNLRRLLRPRMRPVLGDFSTGFGTYWQPVPCHFAQTLVSAIL
jgi:hypothetical protein